MMKRIPILVWIGLSVVSTATAQLNTDRLMSMGRSALYFEDYVLSIQYFNQVILSKPQLIYPYFYRGIAKIQLEDYVGAESDFDIVVDRNPFIPMAYYARGFALANMQRWSDAISDFTLALQYSPDNMLYLMNRARACAMSGRYADALADIDYLLRQSSSSTDLLMERGIVQLQSADTIGAFDTFARIAMTDSLSADVWGAYGTTAMMLGHDSIALAALDKSVNLGTTNQGTFINRGILHYRHHRYRNAIADYDRAVALDSTSSDALFNRALLRMEIGDYNGAENDLSRILSLNPQFYEAVYQRALVYNIIGEEYKAIADYTKLLERYPTFVPALYGRAEIYDKTGNRKAAFADREKAYTLRMQHNAGTLASTDTVSADAHVSDISSRNSITAMVQMFNTNPDNNIDNNDAGARGMVQNRNVNLVNEPNICLSFYYSPTDNLPIVPYNPNLLQELNRNNQQSAPFYLVVRDVKLSASMINLHFESINKLSEQIAHDSHCAHCYFVRALDYATVQDFPNAIEDLTKSIILDSKNAMTYFCRANVRYKQLEFDTNNDFNTESFTPGADNGKPDNMPKTANQIVRKVDYSSAYELIMRDYDHTLSLAPDFAFAWYNRANLLVLQHDYKTAIDNYNRAIDIEPRLAEAYFNRGLTYLLSGDRTKAIRDLSKSGELGIYRAYGIIKRLQAN